MLHALKVWSLSSPTIQMALSLRNPPTCAPPCRRPHCLPEMVVVDAITSWAPHPTSLRSWISHLARNSRKKSSSITGVLLMVPSSFCLFFNVRFLFRLMEESVLLLYNCVCTSNRQRSGCIDFFLDTTISLNPYLFRLPGVIGPFKSQKVLRN